MRLIDADALLEKRRSFYEPRELESSTPIASTCVTVDDIYRAPTIDAAPVVHARVVWKNRFMGEFVPGITITDRAGEKHTGTLDTTHYEPVPYCSECGKELGVSSLAYCPNCGAKMDGGAEA